MERSTYGPISYKLLLAIENRFVNKKTKKERSTYGPISHELLVIENRFVNKKLKISVN